VVVFSAPPSGPQVGTDSVITYVEGAKIAYHYDGDFSEASSPSSPTATNGQFSGEADFPTNLITTASADAQKRLKTYIPSFGGSFFTGNSATATDVDKLTTRLKVPTDLGLTTAAIDEVWTDGGQTNDTLTTNTTTITIPARRNAQGAPLLFDKPVTIELRRDASTIRTFNTIDRVPLYYAPDIANEPSSWSGGQVPSCHDSSYYSPTDGPSANYPICVQSRMPISKRTVLDPPITDADVGDWLFILNVLQNGKTSW